jgi:trehalose transport system substrate-binding protein
MSVPGHGRLGAVGGGRRRALLAAIGVAAVLAAACQPEHRPPPSGSLAGRRITFSISLAEEEKRAVQDLLRRFGEKTGARVDLVSITAEDLPEKLKVDVGAGRPTIDLFAQANLLLLGLVEAGLVEDLSDVAVPEAVLPQMRPERFGGRQYFLPFRPNVQLAYVNRARFEKAGVAPPATVEELETAARRLKATARGLPKITLPLAEGAPAAVTITEWVVMFGGHPLVLNDGGSVLAFEFLQRLWREGLLARESLLGKYDTQIDFLLGETAWLAPNWPFTSGVLAEQDLLDRFLVYPGWRGPARAAHVIGGDVLGIPSGVTGARREAAVALAQFLMGREAQEVLVERNTWPSIRADAYGRVAPAQRETFEAIQIALADGIQRPHVRYWADVSEAMNDAVRRILERGEPARTVLDTLHGRIAAAARRSGSEYPPGRQ